MHIQYPTFYVIDNGYLKNYIVCGAQIYIDLDFKARVKV